MPTATATRTSGIVDQFGRAIPSSRHSAIRALKAKYDAAQTSDHNTRHWANADGLSAATANSPGVRRILRNRARYEVANNSYARGILLTLANDTIGTGPQLQLLSKNRTANLEIERHFRRWANAIDLAGKLRTMRIARAQDGETFAILTTNPKLQMEVQLDLRLIEPEQISSPTLLPGNDADGITFDNFGNPVSYNLIDHPGDSSRLVQDTGKGTVPAEAMIHLFRNDRPGQVRGIPEITPALPLFAQLRRFTLATIAAAETAAEFAGVMYTDSSAIEEPEDVDAMDAIELELRAMLTLPRGWKMGQVKAEHPATTYEMFKAEIINEIARCLNMPYNVAAGNSSAYNYASGRLDHQVYFKAIRVDQVDLELRALDRILLAWLDEAALAGILPSTGGPFVNWDHQWFWDGHEHVDPAKEANAQATRLANHTTTLATEYARQGRDWEAELRQRAREVALQEQMGLSLPNQGTPDSGDNDDDDPPANKSKSKGRNNAKATA